MSSDKYNELKGSIDNMATSSLRCIAFAYCPWELRMVPKEDLNKWQLPEDNLTLLGMVAIKDPCRPGVRDSVQLCSAAGVKVRMVTGDNVETAKAIALECGILKAHDVASETMVIEGKAFREMSETAREEVADKITVMGRSSPNDKLLLVQALKRKGHVVAITGDGTNDAPALHEIFNKFKARKPEEKNVFAGVMSNHLFIGIVGITTVFQFILQILIIEFLGRFFGTVRLSWKLWLLSVAIGAVSWPLAYLGKSVPVPNRPFQDYFKHCSPGRRKHRDEEQGGKS